MVGFQALCGAIVGACELWIRVLVRSNRHSH